MPPPPNLAPLQWNQPLDTRPNEIREALNAQQMANLTEAVPKPQVKGRPTSANILQGQLFVNWIRKGIVWRLNKLVAHPLPESHRPSYFMTFDVLWGFVFEMDPLLPVYACWMREEVIRSLIFTCTIVKHQKLHLSPDVPRVFLDLKKVHGMLDMVQQTRLAIANAHRESQLAAAEARGQCLQAAGQKQDVEMRPVESG
ncbi:uncharacterized protein FIBRA_06171 [Fibroporia radiculosa]|uniref:Uncharacterized protein n=1 Tax=Fibroporia radiculosa TaxID=599839 RepID=J4H3X7_9APHY|nr:uncharacterized protein FIBRA_06171 [Fibroporia radiculosa]CCM04014.1 predicted protein [Fibroporia radiculosa]